MRGNRIIVSCLVAIASVLAPARSSFADWQNPVGVCKDSRGCGSDSGSVGGTTSSSGGGSFRWGHAISDNLADTKRTCRDEAFCTLLGGGMSVIWGAIFDGPYYAVKGVGYGLLYGGKGLYYGARGLGKGVAYTGRAIGRGLAYPFNRPPKPILPPTTWEQYKHDVLKHQKTLAKADKANKENQRWCVKNVPLEISPNRSKWEDLCNAGDAVSRAALPHDILVATTAPVPVESVAATANTAAEPPIVAALSPTAAPAATTVKLPETSNEGKTSSQDEKMGVAAAAEPLTAAPPVGAPVPPPIPTLSGDSSAPAQQQIVQTGVAPEKAALNGAAPANFTPTSPAPGTHPIRTLPSETPANILTPSEYGFEGRGGYSTHYDQVWGKETPADEFIAKWNIIGPLTSMQETVRHASIEKNNQLREEEFWGQSERCGLGCPQTRTRQLWHH